MKNELEKCCSSVDFTQQTAQSIFITYFCSWIQSKNKFFEIILLLLTSAMITSLVCHGFCTSVEAFSCTEFGCAVRSALLAEFQAHLFFVVVFKYSIIFLKPVCLRHRGMDCFSPCRPLLPFWLGKGMATLLRGSLDSARFGFPLWTTIIPRFCSAIPSPCFLLGVSTLPYLPSRSRPSHLCSAFPRPSGRRWVAVPEPPRREHFTSLKLGNFVLLTKRTSKFSICYRCWASCAALAVCCHRVSGLLLWNSLVPDLVAEKAV